jgi:hypothetical protein
MYFLKDKAHFILRKETPLKAFRRKVNGFKYGR